MYTERYQRVHQMLQNITAHLHSHREVLRAEAEAGTRRSRPMNDDLQEQIPIFLQQLEELLQYYQEKIDDLAALQDQRLALMIEDGST